MRPKARCQKCGAELMRYWLKAGVCNGCFDPKSVITAKIEAPHIKRRFTVRKNREDFRVVDHKRLGRNDIRASRMWHGTKEEALYEARCLNRRERISLVSVSEFGLKTEPRGALRLVS